MTAMNLGLKLMLYGLSGVFSVLILFYGVIKVLGKMFPYKEAN